MRLPTNRELHFPFEDGEALVKIMTVGRRPRTSRHAHIDQAIAAAALLATYQNGIGIADTAK
jgi:hypothetical protein